MATTLHGSRRAIHFYQGESYFLLEAFGDWLAEKHGYKSLAGFEAARYYLMQKHNWLPRDVLAMSLPEIEFALHVERQSWKPPKEVLAAAREELPGHESPRPRTRKPKQPT